MKCPHCDGEGYIAVLVQFGANDLDIDHELCEDCEGTGMASAYTASVMGSAKAQYKADRPYLKSPDAEMKRVWETKHEPRSGRER